MLPHNAQEIFMIKKTRVTLHRSGKSLILNCNFDEYCQGLDRYQKGALIQDSFPFLTDTEREFLLTGITDQEWDDLFLDKDS